MTIKQYRKKPVVIEAYQFDGSADFELMNWLNKDMWIAAYVCVIPEDKHGWHLEIETFEGIMTAKPGDYIIRGVHGEFYPCKPDIFELTYESVES